MTEESQEVAEARAVICEWHGGPPRSDQFGIAIDALIEAVRKDERRRLGVEEGWERGVI